jgi:hypothetical protein
MAKTTSRSNTAQGPAIGSTGAGLGGALRGIAVTPGQFVGTVSVRLRTRNLETPIQPGSVGVEVALVLGGLVAGAAPVAADAINSRPAEWAKFGYVWTGHGCVWHPNVFVNPDAKGQILVRVWNRDDLDATARIMVDVSVTCSEEPVPGSDTPDPTYSKGTGTKRTIVTSNPIAGAEAIQAVPAGLRWRCDGWYATLVADATVINRVPHVTVFDGTLTRIRSMSFGFAVASQTVLFEFAVENASLNSAAGVYASPMSGDLVGIAGESFRSLTTNLQAGDDWGAATVQVEEWVQPQVAAS